MDVCSVPLARVWIGVAAVLLASGWSGVGGVGVWDDDVPSLERLDGEAFKRLVNPLVEMAANAYRYPGVIDIPGWTLVDAVAPVHGGMHAVVYKNDSNAGRMVLAFRGTDISGSESSTADMCADELLWGETSFLEPENCSQFSSDTLDYYKQSVDYTRVMLEAYPQASFLLTGHSLGAALAILVAATFRSKPVLPIIAFSSGATREVLHRMSLELTSDHDNKLYVVADKWDYIMRTSWENQIGTLCLYETSITEDCAACFEGGTVISPTESCKDFENGSSHTPSKGEASILELGEGTEQHLQVETNQSEPASTGSSADCRSCFFETHYLKHVIDLVELGNKPACEYRKIRST